MKLRCSTGFEVGEYYGPGILDAATDEVSVATANKLSVCADISDDIGRFGVLLSSLDCRSVWLEWTGKYRAASQLGTKRILKTAIPCIFS